MRIRRFLVVTSLILTFSIMGAATAFAQYLQPAEPGYLPAKSEQTQPQRLPPCPGPLCREAGPPPVRYGLAIDFGAGGLQNLNLDSDFFVPNGAPAMRRVTSAAWDLTVYAQFHDSFRAGINVGQLIGGKSDRQVNLLHVGLDVEGGHRFENGLGLWLGASIGYGHGKFQSTEYTVWQGYNVNNIYTYTARGIGVRAFGRIEYSVAPFVTLRLTPFVDTMVRTNDSYMENVPMMPEGVEPVPAIKFPRNTHGTFLGYGVMIGVSFHSF